MWWLLVGCGLTGSAEPEAQPGNSASVEAPDRVESDGSASAAPVDEASEAPKVDLAGQWVVIVGSASEAAPELPDLSALDTLDPPVEPLIIDSSAYSKLSPCLKVAVAAHTPDRKAIFAELDRIAASGVQAYAKPLGEATGKVNATDARCVAAREPEVCPGDVLFAERWGAKVYVPAGMSEADAKAALAEPGGDVPLDDQKRAWARPLSITQAGALAKSSPVTVRAADGSTKACTVSRFVGLTRGQPHWGYLQEGDPTQPGCGEPIVAAELDCDLEGAIFASKGSSAKAVVPTPLALTDEQKASAMGFVEAFPAWKARVQEARSRASERDEELETKVELEGYTLGDTVWIHARMTALTGEGIDYCGIDEVYESASLLMKLEGITIQSSKDLFWVEGLETITVVDVDGDGIPERRLERFRGEFGPAVIDARNVSVCEADTQYCDSPC